MVLNFQGIVDEEIGCIFCLGWGSCKIVVIKVVCYLGLVIEVNEQQQYSSF